MCPINSSYALWKAMSIKKLLIASHTSCSDFGNLMRSGPRTIKMHLQTLRTISDTAEFSNAGCIN